MELPLYLVTSGPRAPGQGSSPEDISLSLGCNCLSVWEDVS